MRYTLSETPFGQLPVLQICKDVTICQSHAIEYYVAKKYGKRKIYLYSN